MKKLMALSLTVLLAVGCQTLYTTVVTITQVRESVMTELGRLYREGKIPPAMDKKIADADAKVRTAAAVCEQAIMTAKLNGTAEPVEQLKALKMAINEIIVILADFSQPQTINRLQVQLQTAERL